MATMTVVLGTVGTVTIDGTLEGDSGNVELFVDSSVSGRSDGLSWASAYSDLQAALAKSDTLAMVNPGKTISIYIAKGSYYPSANGDTSKSFVLRNHVQLLGGYPSGGGVRNASLNVTILSGTKGSYHIVKAVNIDPTSVMDGLTISGGSFPENNDYLVLDGLGLICINSSPKINSCNFENNSDVNPMDPYDNDGGAIYDSASSPSITNCAFLNNKAVKGGAILNVFSSPIIIKCQFTNNKGVYWGNLNNSSVGGICNISSSTIIDGCNFIGNFGTGIGAIANINSSSVITNCTFQGNTSREYEGGGAIGNSSSSPLISNCNFTSNFAADGGGGAISNSSSSPKILNCSFSRNYVVNLWNNIGGGAISNKYSSSSTITNCTFVYNRAEDNSHPLYGGAIFDDSSTSSIITNCSFANNLATVGGAYYGSLGKITNCIFWGDSASESNFSSELSANIANVKNCIISGGYSGGILIKTDNPNLGIFTNNGGPVPTCAIPVGSSAQNSGTTSVPAGVDISSDARGMPRSDGFPDIGAYEIQ
jgi:hypothetical protein